MKLTCPNCAAQYEVPDEVIPETGRDVQCSACGDTWFQVHPDHPDYKPAFDPDAPEEDFEEDAVEEASEEAPEPPVEPEPDPAPDYDAAEADDDYEADTDEEHADEEVSSDASPRRELPEDVTSVLKEEAELETRAREADMAGGLETQPDLGLSETQELERRTREAKARMARLRGFDDTTDEPVSGLVQSQDPDAEPDPQEPEIDLGTRSNLFPQVEEVDQRIEAQSDTAGDTAAARDGSRVATQKEGRSGFGRGLRLAIILALIAAGLYIFAPQLSQTVPALEAPLSAYTQMVDQGRTALQQLVGQ